MPLAQLNVAEALAPLDSPIMSDFVANLNRINQLAEQSDGFVWRLQSPSGDATDIRPFGPNQIVNMSAWRDVESLKAFVYRSAHTDILRRKKEWFEPPTEPIYVLWWIPEGHLPTVEEAKQKLDHLRTHGPTAEAFDFRDPRPEPLPA
jgi:Domain of unknown function (DUF3291)